MPLPAPRPRRTHESSPEDSRLRDLTACCRVECNFTPAEEYNPGLCDACYNEELARMNRLGDPGRLPDDDYYYDY